MSHWRIVYCSRIARLCCECVWKTVGLRKDNERPGRERGFTSCAPAARLQHRQAEQCRRELEYRANKNQITLAHKAVKAVKVRQPRMFEFQTFIFDALYRERFGSIASQLFVRIDLATISSRWHVASVCRDDDTQRAGKTRIVGFCRNFSRGSSFRRCWGGRREGEQLDIISNLFSVERWKRNILINKRSKLFSSNESMFTCDAISCSILIYNSVVHRVNAAHIVRYLDVVNYANVIYLQDAEKLPGCVSKEPRKLSSRLFTRGRRSQKIRMKHSWLGIKKTATDCQKIKPSVLHVMRAVALEVR